ncbi:MAG: hypothetical protein R2789_12690 [Microthrixaceae bacterium]
MSPAWTVLDRSALLLVAALLVAALLVAALLVELLLVEVVLTCAPGSPRRSVLR